ncbi:MAG: sigma-54-dependent transcriptional regulator, partial [Bradymonadaceae bacterium]
MSPPSLLLIDDDRAFRKVYGSLLRAEGFEVQEADDRPSARKAFLEGGCDIVLLDLMLPPDGSVKNGLEQLADFLSMRPEAKIIVISGAGDTRFMLQAVREGAYDFLTKPVDPDVVLVVVQRALARTKLERQVANLQDSLTQARPDGSMLGQSPSFLRALELAERVAPTDLPILVTGENGTGKELMARTVHERSLRQKAPFLAVNCGALPDNLLESALFGHVKGAFTGAIKDRPGLFAEAHGGTLFLDEIGDMPAHLQVKLLRTLESGEILPVGADRPSHVDVRIISATNRDLLAMLETGDFREDLYWRIKGAEVHLPPLRDRLTDIPLLATFFLNKAGPLCPDGQPRRLGPDAE